MLCSESGAAFYFVSYCDQQMHNYFTDYHTPTRFDTIVPSSRSFKPIPCQVTQVYQMQLFVRKLYYQQLRLKYLCNLTRY